MTSRPTTDPSAVRPRSRHAEAHKEMAVPAAAVVSNEAPRDWILIRVPKVSVAKAKPESAPAVVAASVAAPVPQEDKPPKKHFRIDAAHGGVAAPHVAAEGWTERQSKWVARVGGWKTLTAVGLVVAVLIGAVAARSGKKDRAEDSVTSSEKTEQQLERERRLARRRAIEAAAERRGASDREQPVDPSESDEAADNSTNTATTASWQFEAATNTPASLNGRNGRATAVNLNVERSDRAAQRNAIRDAGPSLPRSIGRPADDQARDSADDLSNHSAVQPRYRMAANELPSYGTSPRPAPGTVQLQGSIDHAPLHTAP